MDFRRLGGVASGGLAVVVSVLLLGCGGGSDGSGNSTGSSSQQSSDNVAAAQQQVDAYQHIPEFKPPGEAFDARKVAGGKTIFVIPLSSSIHYVQSLYDRLQGPAKEVGVKLTDWPNQGSVSEWVRGMETAIDRKVDSIDLLGGIDPAKLGPQIRRAKAAGIPVTVSATYGVGDEIPSDVSSVSLPYETGGGLLADWTIADSKGDADVLVITMNEVIGTKALVKGIKEGFAANCAECKVDFLDISLANFQQQLQPQVEARLNKDPNINYVIATFDSAMAPFAQAAIRTVGRQNQVKVVASDGTPSVLKDVQNHNGVSVDVGYGLDWIAHAILDQHMRAMGGLETVEDPKTPLRIFDETNIDETGKPPVYTKGYGDSYLSGYDTLWQLEK